MSFLKVSESKFRFSSNFYKFSFRIFIVFCFEVIWPWQAWKGVRDWLIFEDIELGNPFREVTLNSKGINWFWGEEYFNH